MKSALLISTYNWPAALDLVLKSAMQQTQFPDEILIADDGSDKSTKGLIESYQKRYSIPINHIWQEDQGFRKSHVLNKAIASSSSEYIIQVDGDCILHKDFIKDHLERATAEVYLFGSRVNIKKEAIPEIFKNGMISFSFFSKKIGKRTRNLRIPFLRDRFKEDSYFSTKVRGCNISFWREDFININGYNEDIEGWGREDSELILRLINCKVQGIRLRYGGIVYHIFHKEASKANLNKNSKIQLRTITEKLVWCNNGVDKYLKENENPYF